MSGSDSSRRSTRGDSSSGHGRSPSPGIKYGLFSIDVGYDYPPKRSADPLPSHTSSNRNLIKISTTSSSSTSSSSSVSVSRNSKYVTDSRSKRDREKDDYYKRKSQMTDGRHSSRSESKSSGDNFFSKSTCKSILDCSRESSIHLKSLSSSGSGSGGSGSGSRRNSTESKDREKEKEKDKDKDSSHKDKDKDKSSKKPKPHEFLEPLSPSTRSKKKSSKKHSGTSKKSKSKVSPLTKENVAAPVGLPPVVVQPTKSSVGIADDTASNSSGGYSSDNPNSPMTPPVIPTDFIDNGYIWGEKYKRPATSMDFYCPPPPRTKTPEAKRFKRFTKKFASPDAMEKKRFSAYKDYFNRFGKMREYGAHGYKVHSVGWNCDGRRLASGSCDKTVALFTLDGFKLKLDHMFRGHTDSVDQLRWHPKNPDVLGTASGDKTVKIWDARDERNVESYSTAGENINIAWSPEGNEIAVGNKDDLITFFDIRAGKPIRDEPYKFEVNEICWNPKGDEFFLTNGDGCIYIHHYPSMVIKKIIKAHPSNCICVEFSRGGKYFAVGAADAVVSLWDYKEMCCVRTFSRLDWPVRTISFNYDGSLIASGSEDLQIDLALVSTGEQVVELNVDAPTFTVAWHPSRNLLAYAGDDKNKYERDRDKGTIRLFGLPSE